MGDGIVAILVSDGLCMMMGADRDDLISLLNGGLFERIHPDDAGRIARIVREFANRLCNYDVIYRGKYNQNDDYHYIHADPEGNADITNVYELYIDRHSTPAER